MHLYVAPMRWQKQPWASRGSRTVDEVELKLLVADDHAMILDMFDMYVSSLSDISLRTAPDLDAALKLVRAEGPFDIVLLDYSMPGMNGLDGLVTVLQENGGKPVGILTGNPTVRMVDEVMEKGGAGVILKSASLRSLINTIRFMAAGEKYVPMNLINEQNEARKAMPVPLSDREFSVLVPLADGLSNRDIGETLGLAEPTVKMHVQSICKKLGAQNRTQAVVTARNLNLI